MSGYRLYFLDCRGKIFAAEEIDAGSDDLALRIAKSKWAERQNQFAFELWQGKHRIHPPAATAAADIADDVVGGSR